MLSGVRQIDFSLAARTACFDIENKCWDEELILDIPAERTDPRNAHAKEGIADCLRMEKPQKDYEEMCYYHTLKYGRVSAYNPKIKKRVTMSFKRSELPFFTEWNRSRPPSATVCGATSKRADRLCQKPVCSAGSTTTISAPGSAAAKLLIVRANMGMPPSSMNCLGRAPPMRLPPPPATMMTPVCRSISVSFRIRGYCP